MLTQFLTHKSVYSSLKPMDFWSYNTLHRARVIGQRTLERTRQRKVAWPVQDFPPPRVDLQDEEPCTYTSLDEAFSRVLNCMSETSRQCKKYYRSNPPTEVQVVEQRHCNRFHKPRSHMSNKVLEIDLLKIKQTDKTKEYTPCTCRCCH